MPISPSGRSRSRITLVLLFVLLASLAGPLVSPGARAAEEKAAKLTIEPGHGLVGQELVVKGERFPAEVKGELRLAAPAQVVAEFETDKRGEFEARFVVPELTPGEYELSAELDEATLSEEARAEQAEAKAADKLPKARFVVDAPPTPTEVPTDEPTEVSEDAAAETTVETTEEEATDEVTEEVAEEVTEEATDEPTEEVTDEPTEEITEEPTEPVVEDPTDTATEAPTDDATEDVTEEVTEEAATEDPTEAVTDDATEAATDEATEEPTEAATEAEDEAETLMVAALVSDVRITLKCDTNPETIRVTNVGDAAFTITGLTTLVDTLDSEPFTINRTLEPGRTAIYQAGWDARYGTVLTKRFILTNAAGDKEGVKVMTSAGTATQTCPPRTEPATVTASVSDVRITLKCDTNPETIRVTNVGNATFTITGLTTLVDTLDSEPFAIKRVLEPGRTAIYQSGWNARYGTVLTKRFILTNAAGDKEGVKVITSAGTATKLCPPRTPPPDIDLSHSSASTGGSIKVTGSGFRAGETVAIHWNSTSLPRSASVNADRSGNFSTSVAVPISSAGEADVIARGLVSKLRAKDSVVVKSSGTAYYVSPSGSDSNDGTSPSRAWRTFRPVYDRYLASGSVVLAQAGGVWTETVRPRNPNISFGVYGTGARPKIIAPDGGYAFHNGDRSGIKVEGWEFTSNTRRGVANYGIVYFGGGGYVVRNVVVHGTDTTLFSVRGERGLVENSEFYDVGISGSSDVMAVSIGGYEGKSTAPNPANVTIFRNNHIHDVTDFAMGSWGTNILIEGNRIERYNTNTGGGGIKVVGRGFLGSVTVRGNQFIGTGREWRAMWADFGPNDRVVFENNYAVNAIHCGFAEATNNVLWKGNTCEKMSKAGIRIGGGDLPAGISLNCTIIGNTFIGAKPTEGWAIVTNGSTAEIRDNIFLP